MDWFNMTQGQTFSPGQRIVKVNGFEKADNYPLPRDCEAIFLDEESDIMYIKKTDANGSWNTFSFDVKIKKNPKFDPNDYVTKDDLKAFKEDLLNAINDSRTVKGERAPSQGSMGNQQGTSAIPTAIEQ